MKGFALRRLAQVSVLLLTTAAVHAQLIQFAQPNETDLHANYCSEVIEKLDIPYYEKALASLGQPSVTAPNLVRDKLVESMQNYLNTSRASLRRLTLYLAPRVINLNLDLTGLMGAQAAADGDIDRINAAISNCLPGCTTSEASKQEACMTECVVLKMPDIEVIKKKFQACRDLSWMPF